MAGPFDNHFLILAPDLPGVWFTQAARQFWLAFQPAVLNDWQSLKQIPTTNNILVTVLARPQSEIAILEQIKNLYPNLHLDMVIADDLTTMEVQLNKRAESGQPLGVAE
ncbi:MAG: hypothetical protein JXJ17_16135 [Anaerolineae bacterium]|nr:hypothetical protein [Anaerolineae bacterium]